MGIYRRKSPNCECIYESTTYDTQWNEYLVRECLYHRIISTLHRGIKRIFSF